ncbi:potassium/sodium hyperpolarization-activated cyclic nucleotide-gated channel 1 [Histomonas meleagridis]|uniref:potassium/sodium hyperpolarization-activated cyclic nucleotide-gated channel 1 n=1 Tax=Histomonas meleagridis TaxID=135588 RepID=UPI003559BBC2|nr:potassium/sodium hyperpolarization-activated cyclic nucleotide-gated channel 1 [Histomonas meleagridis]KAH0799145.1 potassium/sodium hyperpolarization-activated cyclic nucleotide-gated channel 1 [Histomonas meleagridis]
MKTEKQASNETPSVQMPMYWEILNEADQQQYIAIRNTLSSSACKHRRHHSSEINQEIISTLKAFVYHDEADIWKRSLVCGICWIDNALAINTHQLRLLLAKCKSSINAMFQNIGYMTVPTNSEYAGNLSNFFPIIKDNFVELRKWTIRLMQNPNAAAIKKGQITNHINIQNYPITEGITEPTASVQ